MSAALRIEPSVHPDADLLALCARLAELQEEWQRLWQPTSEDWGLDAPPITEADHTWLAFNDHVWPAVNLSRWSLKEDLHPDDLPGQLLDLHAATPEGARAKAAAILAMEDASYYGANVRNDACEMLHSALLDVVGPARCLMGEDRK